VAGFFRTHYPHTAPYISQISPLSGGYVNFVYRVLFSKKLALPDISSHDTYDSVILKYAPPYLASMGPTAPFSQDRLKFEAQALHTIPSTFPDIFQHDKRVGLPHLIDHKPGDHVLIMQDLGPLESLLSAPQHLTPECASVAATFISSLHALSRSRFGSSLAKYRNEASTKAVIDLVYKPTGEILRDNGIENWEVLDKEAQEIGRKLYDEGGDSVVLLMGDLWSGSLLVDVSPEGLFSKLWIIDWEYSNLGHPILDISYLITIIWIQAQKTDKFRKEIQKFITTFLETYDFLDLIDIMKHDLSFSIHFGVSLVNEAAFGRWCTCEPKAIGKICPCTNKLFEEGVKVLQKPGYLYDLLFLPIN